MPVATGFILVVSMDIAPEKEALFHEVYAEHCAYLKDVPGVQNISRFRGDEFAIALGGAILPKPAASPRFIAVYEIDSPDVLTSDAWAAAVEKGRWSDEIRPYTSNRTHALYAKLP